MFKKLKSVILDFLSKGLSPRKISIGVALGICMGIFPIYGPITVICFGLAWILRLNAPLVVAGCYSMTFVKPVLILPFLKLGEWIFRADPMGISLTELTRQFFDAPFATLQEFAWSFLHAIVGWLSVLLLLMPVIYFITLRIVHTWQHRMKSPDAPDENPVPLPSRQPSSA